MVRFWFVNEIKGQGLMRLCIRKQSTVTTNSIDESNDSWHQNGQTFQSSSFIIIFNTAFPCYFLCFCLFIILLCYKYHCRT